MFDILNWAQLYMQCVSATHIHTQMYRIRVCTRLDDDYRHQILLILQLATNK